MAGPAPPRPPLLMLAPIVPCRTGNGLAMRAASFAEAASADFEVRVAVLEVAGALPFCAAPVAVMWRTVAPGPRPVLGRRLAALLTHATWRQRMTAAGAMPAPARAASPALAEDVVTSVGAAEGTPVHVMRSYLAPLGLAVAERLSSPWCTLDLDDDDEALAISRGDATAAAGWHRLVASFAPPYAAVSLASPAEADALGRRHGLPVVSVANSVRIPPAGGGRPRGTLHAGGGRSGVLLFAGNLTYAPNLDAAVTLVEQVLPRLAACVDRPLRVVLAGSYDPNGPLADLAGRPNVTLTGHVADLAPHYEQAELVAAPLSSGGGTRIKLLEAFARQVPVVTTRSGASGLAVRHGEHLLVADTLDAFVEATATLIAQPELARRLALAAFAFVRAGHSPPVAGEQVRALLALAAAKAGGSAGAGSLSR